MVALLSLIDLVTGEMMLLPGVERIEHREGEAELRVGGKTFAHIHGEDRVDACLPSDLKEALIARGLASRSPETHDREGWVVLRPGPGSNLAVFLRVLHAAYKHISSTL